MAEACCRAWAEYIMVEQCGSIYAVNIPNIRAWRVTSLSWNVLSRCSTMHVSCASCVKLTIEARFKEDSGLFGIVISKTWRWREGESRMSRRMLNFYLYIQSRYRKLWKKPWWPSGRYTTKKGSRIYHTGRWAHIHHQGCTLMWSVWHGLNGSIC